MKTAKNVMFRIKLAGKGIVNYDDSQGEILEKLGFRHLLLKDDSGKILRNNNINYAKKRFFETEVNGVKKYGYNIVASGDWVRNAIFGQDMHFTNPLIGINEDLFISFIAHPATYLRGYMQTLGKGSISFGRKSPVSVEEATISNGAISNVEVGGIKGSSDATSLRYTEVIGETEYKTACKINLQELSFTSLSTLYNRQSFDSGKFELYKEFMKANLPSFEAELGHYYLKNAVSKVPELGFTISNETIVDLIKYFANKLLTIDVTRAKAHARTTKVEYKVVYDPLVDLFENEDGWVQLESTEDVDKIDFPFEPVYLKTIDPLSIDMEKQMIQTRENKAKDKKDAKAAEQEAKKKRQIESKTK